MSSDRSSERVVGGRTRRAPALYALTIGLAGLEAALLQGFHFVAAVPLAPQVSAPAPFGVFHDLRWVWTFAASPLSAALLLAGVFAFRTLVDAAIVRLAWPDDSAPPLLTLLRRSALFTLLAGVAVTPWVTLTFVAGALGFSTLMLGAVVGFGLTMLVLPPGIITGQWWRRALPVAGSGWRLITLVEVMLAALAITFAPGWVAVLVALTSGAFNAYAWQRIVAAVVGAGKPRWTVPALPVVALLVPPAILAAGGYLVASAFAQPDRPLPEDPLPAPAPFTDEAEPVIFISGFGSEYDGGDYQLLPEPFRTIRFSYRGLGPAGEPLPFRSEDTYQSLRTSALHLAALVEVVHAASGEPVSLVAESQGSLVARTYLAAAPDPPVDAVVETSPLLRPARVYYPERGEEGFGWLGGWAGRGMLALFRLEVPLFEVESDNPFVRSVIEAAPVYRDHALCPFPGVRGFLLLPLEAGLTVYRGPLAEIDWATLPAWHAQLLRDERPREAIVDVLTADEVAWSGWDLAFQFIRGSAGAWQSPALPLQAREAWQADPESDPEFGYRDCSPVDDLTPLDTLP